MATKKRKPFDSKRNPSSQSEQYAEFMGALLKGDIKPGKLIETRNGGKLTLSYDDLIEEDP